MILNKSLLQDSNFKVTEHIIGGDSCTFIRPTMNGDYWTEENVFYRSSIWNSKGELVSASYFKFFNLEERPSIYPFTGELTGCSLMEKIDGSCLIISKYNGQLIMRTRGTIDAYEMPNGYELNFLKNKYSEFFNFLEKKETTGSSFIFEWFSPINKIVINYQDEPDLYLTNIINHIDYSLSSQDYIDGFASSFNLKRPQRYQFDTLTELIQSVEGWCGKEGICLYYNRDQNIRKIKGIWYLKLHSFKANCSIRTLLDLYFEWKKPTIEEFKKQIETHFDYECVKMSESTIDLIYNRGINPVNQRVEILKAFVLANKNLDQKSFALKLKEGFLNKSENSIGFALRKNDDCDRAIRNLIEQNIPQREAQFEPDF